MSGLVVKTWRVDQSAPDADGAYVKIVGREGGLIAWLLSHMGVDPTTTLTVTGKQIYFSSASLAGTQSRVIPLGSVCSSYYGYYKPWKVALGIIAGFMWVGSSIPQGGAWAFLTFMLVGIIVAVVYYFLNRRLTLGFVENSGVVNGIMFKRSVIENVDVSEEEAKRVCSIVQTLVESSK